MTDTKDLWRLTVILRLPNSMVTLSYSSKEGAVTGFNAIRARMKNSATDEPVVDQFGNMFDAKNEDISGVIFSHPADDFKAAGLYALISARAQAQAQREAQADLSINSKLVPGLRPVA